MTAEERAAAAREFGRWPDPLTDATATALRSRSVTAAAGIDLTAIYDTFDRMERELLAHREMYRRNIDTMEPTP